MSTFIDTARNLYILDVGHGNCTVVSAGVAGVVIIDIGRSSSLLEFLTEQRITEIKTVYLSHADEDHVGGLVGLLSSGLVQVKRVVVNSDSTKRTKTWEDLVYILDLAHSAGELEFCVGLVSGEVENLDNIEVRALGPSRNLAAKGVGSTNYSGSFDYQQFHKWSDACERIRKAHRFASRGH